MCNAIDYQDSVLFARERIRITLLWLRRILEESESNEMGLMSCFMAPLADSGDA
jgi:hypothetical protein